MMVIPYVRGSAALGESESSFAASSTLLSTSEEEREERCSLSTEIDRLDAQIASLKELVTATEQSKTQLVARHEALISEIEKRDNETTPHGMSFGEDDEDDDDATVESGDAADTVPPPLSPTISPQHHSTRRRPKLQRGADVALLRQHLRRRTSSSTSQLAKCHLPSGGESSSSSWQSQSAGSILVPSRGGRPSSFLRMLARDESMRTPSRTAIVEESSENPSCSEDSFMSISTSSRFSSTSSLPCGMPTRRPTLVLDGDGLKNAVASLEDDEKVVLLLPPNFPVRQESIVLDVGTTAGLNPPGDAAPLM